MTLVELLVVLAILSILAAAAAPFAEMTVRRNQELELRRALRDIRTAIDHFHDDWRRGAIAADGPASAEGYPRRLEVLVEGVQLAGAGRRYYLRRVPRDPFAPKDEPAAAGWLLRSYQDPPENMSWGGQDVFDVRSASKGVALDGSRYGAW